MAAGSMTFGLIQNDTAPAGFLSPVPPLWEIYRDGQFIVDSNNHVGLSLESAPAPPGYNQGAYAQWADGIEVGTYEVRWNNGRVRDHYLIATGSFTIGNG